MIYASLVSQLHRLAPGTSGETSTVTRNGGTLTAADVAAFLDKGTSVIGDQDMRGKPHLYLTLCNLTLINLV